MPIIEFADLVLNLVIMGIIVAAVFTPPRDRAILQTVDANVLAVLGILKKSLDNDNGLFNRIADVSDEVGHQGTRIIERIADVSDEVGLEGTRIIESLVDAVQAKFQRAAVVPVHFLINGATIIHSEAKIVQTFGGPSGSETSLAMDFTRDEFDTLMGALVVRGAINIERLRSLKIEPSVGAAPASSLEERLT